MELWNVVKQWAFPAAGKNCRLDVYTAFHHNNWVRISDFDYCLAKDGIIYLVKGYYHSSETVMAYPVYWPDPQGDRLHPHLGRYTKHVSDFNHRLRRLHPEYFPAQVPRTTPRLPRSEIVQVWQPRAKMPEFLATEMSGRWRDLVDYLHHQLQIDYPHVGIFGSYLVDLHRNPSGQQVKDIDFVIYGLENLHKVRAGLPSLLQHFNYTNITPHHLKHHARKFGSEFAPGVTTWHRTLANKWSSIQMAPGLLCTLRFSYLQAELPPDPLVSPIARPVQVQGTVTDDIGTNFMPRIFRLATAQGEITVVTYFWAFQSAVRNGDLVIVSGNLHQDGHTISMDAREHGIKIIAPATKSSSRYSGHSPPYPAAESTAVHTASTV